ncbi:hypothetical protein FACS1894123_03090 [Bacteroidia bacterium]|nr:hypothetical protein FACS1894123_03090 [Bacteroidia bacterium]
MQFTTSHRLLLVLKPRFAVDKYSKISELIVSLSSTWYMKGTVLLVCFIQNVPFLFLVFKLLKNKYLAYLVKV